MSDKIFPRVTPELPLYKHFFEHNAEECLDFLSRNAFQRLGIVTYVQADKINQIHKDILKERDEKLRDVLHKIDNNHRLIHKEKCYTDYQNCEGLNCRCGIEEFNELLASSNDERGGK